MLSNHCVTSLINLESVKFKMIAIQEDMFSPVEVESFRGNSVITSLVFL